MGISVGDTVSLCRRCSDVFCMSQLRQGAAEFRVVVLLVGVCISILIDVLGLRLHELRVHEEGPRTSI